MTRLFDSLPSSIFTAAFQFRRAAPRLSTPGFLSPNNVGTPLLSTGFNHQIHPSKNLPQKSFLSGACLLH